MNIQRDKIVEAAVKLFYERGYKETTLSQIASAVGISQPAIYYYFKSKLDILREIFRLYHDNLTDNLTNELALPLSPNKKMEHVLRRWISFVAENTTVMKLVNRERRHLPANEARLIIDRDRSVLEKVQEIYEDGIKSRIFLNEPSRIAVLLLIGACVSIRHWYNLHGQMKPNELADIAIKLLKNGYLNSQKDRLR